MKIALVTPMWNTENPYPPLGLAYIGAVLEKHGYTVQIFDLTLKHNKPFENKIEDIVNFSPDIVGISAMSHNYDSALTIAKDIKNKTGAYIVFGGPHPTILPKDVLTNEFVDFVITGEGEDTFLKLCQYFDTRLYNIDGLCYKDNGNIIINPKNNYIQNLDELPLPARHLLHLDNYQLVDDYGEKMATIISSRGCPYRCTYCYKGLFGTTYRFRSPDNIINEIKQCIKDYNYKSFYFIDDLFTLNLERVKELTDSIVKENLDIRWQCLARVNNATSQMFEMMKEAGCYKVHFGIESGNQNILNKAKKGITLDQVKNAVKYCKNAGIKTKGYFMLALPGDTLETMQNTLNFAEQLQLDEMMFSIATPFPGTELWNNIDKTKIKSLSDAFYYSCNSDNINIFYNLSDASDEDIIETAKKAYRMTDAINIRTFCQRTFGKKMGLIAWQISKVPIFRKIGGSLINVSH